MYNQFLLNDFYKITHLLQYSDKITHLTSYLTPRGSRLKGEGIDKVVMFGLSGYIDDYVVKGFNDNFFNRSWDKIAAEVSEVLVKGLGYPGYMVDKTLEKLKELHALGYLPVEINAVLEGTFVPMGVPCVEIRSTDSRFAWVGQSLEASMSAALWHPMVSATIAAEYRKVARKAFKETVDDTIDERTAMCDFSMRGQESNESAVAASAAWLASMWNSSTVMARSYVKEHYRDGEEVTIGGLTSTEHSVMCTHACLDRGDETHTFEYLFDLYKDVSFAAVCDSYDFWNVLTNILPKFKETIDERGKRGKFIGVRHDSADPVEAICGVPCYNRSELELKIIDMVRYEIRKDGKLLTDEYIRVIDDDDLTDVVYGFSKGEGLSKDEESYDPDGYVLMGYTKPEYKGMVETMWEMFGGTINSKGYKVLNPGIKAVYGDSITITRAKQIYERLKARGFAANNVSLGVGSFSFQCLESSNGKTLLPFTRDSFSIAIKCTYAKYIDDEGVECEQFVYKSPKNFNGKKSQKGLCSVFIENNELAYKDNLYEHERSLDDDHFLVPYFRDGDCYHGAFNAIRDLISWQIVHNKK